VIRGYGVGEAAACGLITWIFAQPWPWVNSRVEKHQMTSFFTGEVVFAAGEAPAGGGGPRSHHCDDINREAEFVGKLIG